MKRKRKRKPFDFERLLNDWIWPLLILALVIGFVILVSR